MDVAQHFVTVGTDIIARKVFAGTVQYMLLEEFACRFVALGGEDVIAVDLNRFFWNFEQTKN